MNNDWIDISVPVTDAMIHWPGDHVPSLSLESDMGRGDVCNVTLCEFSAHTGTHMDAPRHFVPGAPSMEQMPLSATLGPARVVAIDAEVRIDAEHLQPLDLQPGSRILFKTRNSRHQWWQQPFDTSFIALGPSGAQFLADRKVACIGIDYLSLGKFGDEGVETHNILLGAGIWAIEGLDLTRVEQGEYELICLPLKLVGADGAPARAALRRLPAR